MNQIVEIANTWGWPITLVFGALYVIGKNWNKGLDWLANFFPILENRQAARIQARERQAEDERLERNEAIRVLTDAIREIRDDRDEEKAERQHLQKMVIEIVKEQGKRDEKLIGALQNIADLVRLQTSRLDQQHTAFSSLTAVIERVVGSDNHA